MSLKRFLNYLKRFGTFYRLNFDPKPFQRILQKTNELQKEKTGNAFISENVSWDMPRIGLEPTHLTAPEPKSGVSTNFTTWAMRLNTLEDLLLKVKEVTLFEVRATCPRFALSMLSIETHLWTFELLS